LIPAASWQRPKDAKILRVCSHEFVSARRDDDDDSFVAALVAHSKKATIANRNRTRGPDLDPDVGLGTKPPQLLTLSMDASSPTRNLGNHQSLTRRGFPP